jgi:hypothetical protein
MQMAFKLAKASGVRVPDMVDHIPADLELSEIVNGTAVSITGGAIDLWATGDAVAGILVNEVGDSRYAAPGSETYSSTFKDKDNVTFIPVTGSLLIEADYDSTATITPVIGGEYQINATADGIDSDLVASDDFRVVNFKYDGAGNITKLLGFFITPGYFTA